MSPVVHEDLWDKLNSKMAFGNEPDPLVVEEYILREGQRLLQHVSPKSHATTDEGIPEEISPQSGLRVMMGIKGMVPKVMVMN